MEAVRIPDAPCVNHSRAGPCAGEKPHNFVLSVRLAPWNLSPAMSEPQTPVSPPAGNETEARTWNMLCHLSALAGFLVPFGTVLGPLLVWQIKKNQLPSVIEHGKAALNFQLTALIIALALCVLGVILSFVCIGALLFPVAGLVVLAGIVFAVIAGIKANDGQPYRYPYAWELIK
jgi:uncharacterized protein